MGERVQFESFHGRFRDEYRFELEQLWTLTEARVVIEDFRVDYNVRRPHSGLDYRTPQAECARGLPLAVTTAGGLRPTLYVTAKGSLNKVINQTTLGLTLHLERKSGPFQKDTDARWTRKAGQRHYGYKLHAKVDRSSKLILTAGCSSASLHDTKAAEALLDESDRGKELHADCAYRGDAFKVILAKLGHDQPV